MTRQLWQEILDQNGLDDALTADDYNLDYSHPINLTIKEIREIAELLKANDERESESARRV